jgi:hypothetical protein
MRTLGNLGNLYKAWQELPNAMEMYSKALVGMQAVSGTLSDECQQLEECLASLVVTEPIRNLWCDV